MITATEEHLFWALTRPVGGLPVVGDSPRPLIAGAMTALPLI